MTLLNNTAREVTPDFAAIKRKQQSTWACGNYGRVGSTVQITGESLCEAMDLRAGSRVLDVAGGNGNASLAAARRFCDVTCTDYVETLLNHASDRASVDGFEIDTQLADAENLPFSNEQFDYVISTFGVMFTPDQPKAASEMVRVCKTGGKIGMANWTPDGFIGQLFSVVGQYVSPPAGVAPASNWATDEFISTHFGRFTQHVSVNTRWFAFRYTSPQHWIDLFKTYYGPILKAFESLNPEGKAALNQDLTTLIGSFNRANDGSMVVPSSYVEVVATK